MGYWITPESVLDRSAFYDFRKTINCSENAAITLKICADTRYQLRVNGEYICEGPCLGDHLRWRYEEVTIPKELLNDGENIFSVRVLFIADEQFWIAARKERPAMWIEGVINDHGESVELTSDESWECQIEEGTQLAPSPAAELGINTSLPPWERVENETELCSVNVKKYVPAKYENGNFTQFGLGLKYILEPRTIPLLKPDAPRGFTEIRRGEDFVELDCGVYTTAYPEFVFKGECGGNIKFIYAECYVYYDGKQKYKKERSSVDGIIEGPFDSVSLNGKEQCFTPFWYRAFRYIRIEFPRGTVFETDKQSYRPFFYPLEEMGTFVCSDPIKNAMWRVSKNTLLCCTHETFADCPYYEQCQYDMDSALEMMFLLRLTGDGRMAKKAIVDLSRSQQVDGMLCAHYPSTKIQIIPNFSLYWILMLKDYVFYSADLELADELLPVAEKVLNYFRRSITEEGLCGASSEYWNYHDWVPSWNIGVPNGANEYPSTITSMLYSAALSAASYLAEKCGRNELSEEYKKRALTINDAVNSHCFDGKVGMYTDVYRADAVNTSPEYSVHTAVWAVLCGARSGSEAKELLERAFNGENVAAASFSFNYYTFRALEKAELYDKYSPRLLEGWKRMLDLDCTTWCENPDSPRSECHAWSSAPIYELSAMTLGVQPLDIGYSEVIIKPKFDTCDSASGTVPTPHGLISVSWEKTENGKLLKITAPSDIKKHISVNGETTVTYAEIFTLKV